MASPLRRVLICDDDPMIRALLKKFLEMLHCEIVGECANGSDAIAMHKSARPDVTLMDINMPDINGVTALNEILKADRQAQVLMLSAMDDTVVAEACIQKGAIGYIQKGVGPEDLFTELEKHLKILT